MGSGDVNNFSVILPGRDFIVEMHQTIVQCVGMRARTVDYSHLISLFFQVLLHGQLSEEEFSEKFYAHLSALGVPTDVAWTLHQRFCASLSDVFFDLVGGVRRDYHYDSYLLGDFDIVISAQKKPEPKPTREEIQQHFFKQFRQEVAENMDNGDYVPEYMRRLAEM